MGRFKKIIPIIVFVLLTLLTILAIRICYGEYLFDRWPWFRASIILSLLTCLWPYVFLKINWPDSTSVVIYASVIAPIQMLLFYPGLNQLGINSDSDLFVLIIPFALIHAIGLSIILKGLKKNIF
jgi:hypothetical protein